MEQTAYDQLMVELRREHEEAQAAEAAKQESRAAGSGTCTMAESSEPCSDPHCPIHG